MQIPTRKKAFHRALKRKEKWAMDIAKHPYGSYAWLLAFYFSRIDLRYELLKTPIFLVPKAEKWCGGYFTVPIKLD